MTITALDRADLIRQAERLMDGQPCVAIFSVGTISTIPLRDGDVIRHPGSVLPAGHDPSVMAVVVITTGKATNLITGEESATDVEVCATSDGWLSRFVTGDSEDPPAGELADLMRTLVGAP